MGSSLFGIVMVIFMITFAFSPDLAAWMARKMSKSTRELTICIIFTIGAVALAVFIATAAPLLNKLCLALLALGLMCIATLFVLSLAFIAIIPERMEKESEEKDSNST